MIIGIDFDGTCVTHEFPRIGEDIGAVPVLKELVKNGHKLILFTMRSNFATIPNEDGLGIVDDHLDAAVKWFKKNKIPLYAINTNPTQHKWTTSPKVYCNLYIDDAALGVPLVHEVYKRSYVDWVRVRELLVRMELIDNK